ncbi:CFC_HP_G0068410.mRNA.1.CDS.1 [Saccharomyces cerevisiae]|nr:CFC_HP_G0068410.mRNA.1.CDS.1 [Saccharomyces cerevisiae]CAI6649397.1 CFC_HP_G0068410.mRNA.1.CDS.1 [Saccharomyces cerevisiae]
MPRMFLHMKPSPITITRACTVPSLLSVAAPQPALVAANRPLVFNRFPRSEHLSKSSAVIAIW